ncbi:hydrogenase iron-sulfur subunit [Desulfosarcina sp.]|uniref:hydrogenase iron-sulfur subunit n=1 Tax=Desulfosarcina sp. TaxID=2027861 RepID=UPI0029A29D2D|nr:hydrogenase iron-sulfur subunit [Desulfosarcina sp.]MDX2489840.1 hydrogenase iron-sulfur subunit [Desulfosarcina sp.]
MNQEPKSKVTIFHCINVFGEGDALPAAAAADNVEINFVKMPCSSMVKDVFLLRAFEAGADVVAVLVCAEGACRYVEGNLRAKKRVKWVKALLDEIGLDGRRLALFNVTAGDTLAAEQFIRDASSLATVLGTNPASVGSRPDVIKA